MRAGARSGRGGRRRLLISERRDGDTLAFARRVVIAAVIAMFVVGFGLALVFGFPLVMLLFGAVLLAVLLRGLGELVAKITPLSARWGVGVVLLLLTAAGVLIAVFAAPAIAARVADVADRVPEAAAKAWSKLLSTPVGAYLPKEPLGGDEGFTLTTGQITQRLSSVMTVAFGVLGDLAVALIVGIYLAISPGQYHAGLIHLVPKRRRARAEEVIDALTHALRWWLVGRFASMAIIGVASGVGLWLLGVPLAGTLGVLTGFLCFVPFVGPLVSLVPPLLFAWVESGTLALWVLALYSGVQLLESYVVTPLIDQRTALLPAALVIASQAIIGFAAGAVGVMLAVPFAVVIMVLVQMLYVQDVLDDEEIEVEGVE